jgi:hypothetical protein
MPPRTNGWDRGKKVRRSRAIRRILILCEDEKSSRDYFSSFPNDLEQVEISCVGTGMNTDSLMEEAIRRKVEAIKNREPYESIWVVFDKDSFSSQQFNRAFDLARNHNEITACWSNECFELWYLLHFCYQNTGIAREQIFQRVGELLEKTYDKADPSVYATLKPHLERALQNAERLEFANVEQGTETENPSTRVHYLIKHLRSLDPNRE